MFATKFSKLNYIHTMKAFKFLSFLLVLSICFISCSDEPQEPEKNQYYILDISVEDGSTFDIDSVFAKICYYNQFNELDTVIIARSAYNNGAFKVFLPKTLNEKYLTNITYFFPLDSEYLIDIGGDTVYANKPFQVDDATAKIIKLPGILFHAYKNNKYIGHIYSSGLDLQAKGWLCYADKPFHLIGEYTDLKFIVPYVIRFDINFDQGWNIYKTERFIESEAQGDTYGDGDINKLKWNYSKY